MQRQLKYAQRIEVCAISSAGYTDQHNLDGTANAPDSDVAISVTSVKSGSIS